MSQLGRRIAIHAGLSQDDEELFDLGMVVGAGNVPTWDAIRHMRGRIVATAVIAGWVVVEHKGKKIILTEYGQWLPGLGVREIVANSRWAYGPVCWVPTNLKRLPEPLLVRGRQGLWNVDPKMEDEIIEQSG